MEHVFPRVPPTDERQVYLRDLGRSRVAYFPEDIDRTFWEVLAAAHATLLANAVDWATNEERSVAVTGPGPFREFVPVGPLTVTLRIPEGRRPRRVQLLVAAKAVGALIVTVRRGDVPEFQTSEGETPVAVTRRITRRAGRASRPSAHRSGTEAA